MDKCVAYDPKCNISQTLSNMECTQENGDIRLHLGLVPKTHMAVGCEAKSAGQ